MIRYATMFVTILTLSSVFNNIMQESLFRILLSYVRKMSSSVVSYAIILVANSVFKNIIWENLFKMDLSYVKRISSSVAANAIHQAAKNVLGNNPYFMRTLFFLTIKTIFY